MKMLLQCLSAGLALAALGCGADEHAVAIEEQLKAQQEIVAIMQGIQDTAGMEGAYETLKRNYRRLSETAARTQKLRPPSKDAQARLRKDYGERWQTILDSLQRETRRVHALPGGEEFFKKLDQLKNDIPGTTP